MKVVTECYGCDDEIKYYGSSKVKLMEIHTVQYDDGRTKEVEESKVVRLCRRCLIKAGYADRKMNAEMAKSAKQLDEATRDLNNESNEPNGVTG